MDAKIEIKSIIDGEILNSEGEEILNSYEGSVTFQEDVTLLSYEEEIAVDTPSAPPQAERIATTISIADGCVIVEKTGAVSSRMHFLLGEKTDTLYHTPFGDMPLTIECTSLSTERVVASITAAPSGITAASSGITAASSGITARISYNLLSGDEIISTHRLEINCKY